MLITVRFHYINEVIYRINKTNFQNLTDNNNKRRLEFNKFNIFRDVK